MPHIHFFLQELDFTTITTDHITGTPTAIEHRQEAIDTLYHRLANLNRTI